MATPIPSNRAKFTLAEVLTATGGKAYLASEPAGLVGVSTDTRQIAPGSIFVALRGDRFDGHTFAAEAIARGASLLIVDQVLPVEVQQVVVVDTLRALGELAAFHRKRWGGVVVAVAGAAGKTTTRCVLSALLTQVVGTEVHSTAGNLNNQIGVPMVLLGLTMQHRYAVVEVGTNQIGEVPLLTGMVAPDVSILTLVDLEHTEGLLSLDAIEQEEGAIFGRSCHSLVVNADDDRATRQARSAAARRKTGTQPSVLTYGVQSAARLRLVRRETETAYVSRLTFARDGGYEVSVSLGLVGAPAAYAVMAGLLGTEALIGRPLEFDELQAGLDREELRPEGRAEMLDGPLGSLIINDSYNANPASMHSALDTAVELVQLRGGDLHLVLGEMRELGGLSELAHRTLASKVQRGPWASVFAIGSQMQPFMDEMAQEPASNRVLRHTVDTVGVAQQLSQLLGPKDVVLVKGSRGVRTERVIAELSPKVNLT